MALTTRESRSVSIVNDDDIEMGNNPQTIDVPPFVADAYNSTVAFLKQLHARMSNLEQWASLDEEDRERIQVQISELQDNERLMAQEIKAYTDQTAAYNHHKYVGLRQTCATFENLVELKFAFVRGNQEEIRNLVDSLAKGQGELLRSHQKVTEEVGHTFATHQSVIEDEQKRRRKLEKKLREEEKERELEKAERLMEEGREEARRVRAEEAGKRQAEALNDLQEANARLAQQHEEQKVKAAKLKEDIRRLHAGRSLLGTEDGEPVTPKVDEVLYAPGPTSGTKPGLFKSPFNPAPRASSPLRTNVLQTGGSFRGFANPKPAENVIPPPPVQVQKTYTQEEVDSLLARERMLAVPSPIPDNLIQIAKLPKRRDPKPFKGDRTEFRAWWTSIEEYISYNKINFGSDDRAMIEWVGGYLEKSALNWHQGRKAQTDRLGLPDNWSSYSQALDKQFTDSHEQQDLMRKMRALRYEGDIQGYLDQMRLWKARVPGLSDLEWRMSLKSNISDELFTRMTMSSMGTSNADFETCLQEIGLGLEEGLRERKDLGLKSPYITGTGQSRSDSKKEKKRDEYTPAKAPPSERKIKPAKSAMKSASKSTEDQPKKQVRFASWDEAHEGIKPDLIDKRKQRKRCTRCAYEGHTWKECLFKWPIKKGEENSPETRKAAKTAAAKRKAEADPEETRASKKAAGIKARQNDRDDLGGQIFEPDSNHEMGDVDF